MHPPDRPLLSLRFGLAAWALVTLMSAVQGQVIAAYLGRPQSWWPTLGYTAAIFSVWALLTPGVLKMADKICSMRSPRAAGALWVLGYPATTALHVLLFVVLFWPVYGSETSTPFTMVKPVLLENLDKSAFAYLALIAAAHLRRRFRERAKVENAADAARTEDEGLWIRVAGGSHLVRFQEIDWITAAGDYAEIHAGDRSLLTDSSLTALIRQLPEKEFARIHRGTIVRIDRVREVRGLGRGDANLFLHTGQALRLSRRYRDKLVVHLPL